MATNIYVEQIYPNEPAEKLINRFMKKYRQSDIYDQIKKYSVYEKPSVKKNRKKAFAKHLNDIY